VHLENDIAFCFGTSERRAKAVNFDVCKKMAQNKLVTIATSLGLPRNLWQTNFLVLRRRFIWQIVTYGIKTVCQCVVSCVWGYNIWKWGGVT